MSDCLGPDGLVPSLLVFGVILSVSVTNKSLPGQRDRMQALALARAEMSTITAELKLSQEIGSKLPPATHFSIKMR